MTIEPTRSDDWLPTEVLEFPDGFLWGTSNASHQVEGGNVNNDWWAWEQNPRSPCSEASGDATDFWNRYEEDLDLCARGGGQNFHRFSLEWSRIEPAEGLFSQVALDHYKRVCDAVIERGLSPMVTFHHFTTPLWAAREGTWADTAIVDRFTRFCEVAAAALGPDRLRYVCTINEPSVVATMGYFVGVFPPGVNDADAQARASANLVRAHAKGYEAIKAAVPDAQTGLCLAMQDVQVADPDDDAARGFAEFVDFRMVGFFVDALRTGWIENLGPAVDDEEVPGLAGSGDYVGVQYYQRFVTDATAPMFTAPEPEGSEVTQMGYASYPPGLGVCLRRAATTELPVIVTENGMATDDDERRCAWIAAHLNVSHKAMTEDGVDLRGYTYWSTTDNFEWALGYGPKFGLIGIDRENGLARVPRPSLDFFDEIARTNRLDPAVVATYVGQGTITG